MTKVWSPGRSEKFIASTGDWLPFSCWEHELNTQKAPLLLKNHWMDNVEKHSFRMCLSIMISHQATQLFITSKAMSSRASEGLSFINENSLFNQLNKQTILQLDSLEKQTKRKHEHSKASRMGTAAETD